jgi:hypothetical protein
MTALETVVPAVSEVEAPPIPQPRITRRKTNWLWYAALSVAVVVTLGGFGLLYQDDITWQKNSSRLTNQNALLNERLLTAQSSMSDSEQQVARLRTELMHPELGIWNVQQKIDGSGWYLAGGVPDTFTYHLNARATGPMSVSILTFEQFAKAIECVDGGVGTTHYCMHHSGVAKTWPDVTSVSYDFHLAEGCANYLVVFTAAKPVTVIPNVSVTYNPAPTFTGDC